MITTKHFVIHTFAFDPVSLPAGRQAGWLAARVSPEY